MSDRTTICLCGSTRFPDAFALANADLSMRGHIVIGLGLFGHADEPRGARFLTSDGDEKTPGKQGLDKLHFAKIDLADEIFVINVGGYIGSSTRREIEYAEKQGKRVSYMFDHASSHTTESQIRKDEREKVLGEVAAENDTVWQCPNCCNFATDPDLIVHNDSCRYLVMGRVPTDRAKERLAATNPQGADQ